MRPDPQSRKSEKPARIGMVVFSHFPRDPRVLREAEALCRAGMDVDVICLRDRHEPPVQHFGQVTAYRILPGTDKKENFPKYLWLTFIFGVAAFLKLLQLSLKSRYAAIQIHNMPDFLVFVGIIHKLRGRPIILDLHDLTPELFETKWYSRTLALMRPLVRFVEKISCWFADHLITTSFGFRNKLVARGITPEKITVVLNTADDKVFKPSPQQTWQKLENGARLLYHGTVARRFGLHVAIKAMFKLHEVAPATKLFIYGKYDPSYRRELEDMIGRLGLERHVILNGYLNREQLVKVIAATDMGVVPYLSDAFMDLALSTKIFEYVSMRVPVVAARIPSITSLFDEASISYFNPGDENDLAKEILELCDQPQLRKARVERAACVHEKIAWPIMAARYQNLIQSVAGVNGRQAALYQPVNEELEPCVESVENC
jgi:glycosyltransferase involved in cell wall biosynthesis